MRRLAFGKYKLVAELGQGGMADVILALAQGPVGFNKLVVVKKLREHLAEDPEFVSMLIDEARLAARLNHPNIVHTHEVGEIDGHFFIAMEYLEGQPLTRLKRRAQRANKDLTLGMQIRIICDLLAGLHYAHELSDYDGTPLNVVHRDVTPSNVFVTYDGVVKVVDFGIAKAGGRSTETKTGVVKGKMTYMPPEQALGLQVNRRADLFSAGVILWEALAGDRMWKGLDDVVVLGKLINGEIPSSPRTVNEDVPEELDAICQKALAVDPNDRFPSASEFQGALEDAAEKLGLVATNRAIGKLVFDLFEANRNEIRQIIETQLAKLQDGPTSSLEPVVFPDGALSSRTPSMLNTSQTEISLGPSGADHLGGATETTGETLKRRRTIAALSLGLAGALAGIVWLMSRGEEAASMPPTPATVASVAPEPPPPGPTAEPAAETVRVSLRAVPADATFSLDGGEALENPHLGEVARDDDTHTVTIEAEGYRTKSFEISFKQDVILDVTLEKEKKQRPIIVVAPKPETERIVPRDKRPDPGREIFRDNPWD